jgi:competence protein ComEC
MRCQTIAHRTFFNPDLKYMSKKEIIIVFVIIIAACVRLLFFIQKPPDYKNFVGQKVELDGIISDDPDIRIKNQHLNIRIKETNANILVFAGREKEVFYGDKIKVIGFLEEPENFITSSGKEFNYKRYLANEDIYFVIKNAEISVLSKDNGNKIKSILFKIRKSFIQNINRVIPIPESDLAGGLILGIRGGFDNETKNEFIETGTMHIIALSGYNISIVAEGVMKVLNLIFSKTISIILGIIVIILFIIMTGASATSIRAGIMAFIMLFGRITGRNYLAGRALIIAGLLMILHDPRVLSDMSFELSFIATGGVLFVTPKVISWFKYLPMRFKIRETIATTIAATISVLPILLYLTGVLSLVSVFANILILLFIPTAMFFVFFTGISGFIFPLLAIPIGYISYLILLYILSVIHFFGSLSFASVTIQSFPLFLTIIIYIFLIWWVFLDKLRIKS